MKITWRVISGDGGEEGATVEKVEGLNGRYDTDKGRKVKNNIGNVKAEELVGMSHGHQLGRWTEGDWEVLAERE